LGLSLFTILVLLRLWFAATYQLNNGILAFFVIAEMAVLMFTIWAFHLQFESQPSLYLKSTALFYVFIVLALRCLRFEPLWVLLSGFTAAISWIILIIYAIREAPTNPITWDYVTYMSSSKIHPGGEFDKVLAIIMVTVILSLVLVRARRLLVRAITQTQASSDLSQFFDPDVARRIIHSNVRVAPGYGELRNAAIMFIDLRGFTKLSTTLTPPEIIELLGEYQQLLVPIIQQHGGIIDKFLGDGIMASFGAVQPSNHYAADALNAVDNMLVTVANWKAKRMKMNKPVINIGAAVAAGEVIFGVIGDASRLEYTVIGNAVNLAAKLEKHTKEEKVSMQTTLETLQLAQQQGYINTSDKKVLTARNVLGVEEPIDLVVLG
jgi:adenylate cyclase